MAFNPMEKLVMNMLEQRAQQNPMCAQLLSLVKAGDNQGVEQMVRGFVESQGKDYNKEFNAFMKR